MGDIITFSEVKRRRKKIFIIRGLSKENMESVNQLIKVLREASPVVVDAVKTTIGAHHGNLLIAQQAKIKKEG